MNIIDYLTKLHRELEDSKPIILYHTDQSLVNFKALLKEMGVTAVFKEYQTDKIPGDAIYLLQRNKPIGKVNPNLFMKDTK